MKTILLLVLGALLSVQAASAQTPFPISRPTYYPRVIRLVPATDGLTVLEVALHLTDDGCRAYYHTAPLPGARPARATPAPRGRKAKGR